MGCTNFWMYSSNLFSFCSCLLYILAHLFLFLFCSLGSMHDIVMTVSNSNSPSLLILHLSFAAPQRTFPIFTELLSTCHASISKRKWKHYFIIPCFASDKRISIFHLTPVVAALEKETAREINPWHYLVNTYCREVSSIIFLTGD